MKGSYLLHMFTLKRPHQSRATPVSRPTPMIRHAVMIIGSVALAGCKTQDTTQTAPTQIANPAAVFCEEQGGRVEIHKEANGDVGYCHLPDGRVVEQWAYFRAENPQ